MFKGRKELSLSCRTSRVSERKVLLKRLIEKMTEWFTVEILFPSLHSKTATQKGYLPGRAIMHVDLQMMKN